VQHQINGAAEADAANLSVLIQGTVNFHFSKSGSLCSLSKTKDSEVSNKALSKLLMRETPKSGVSEKRSNSERRQAGPAYPPHLFSAPPQPCLRSDVSPDIHASTTGAHPSGSPALRMPSRMGCNSRRKVGLFGVFLSGSANFCTV